MEIRKFVTILEETRKEMGKDLPKPVKKAAAIAVIKNPFAGKYQEDLSELTEEGVKLGEMLGTMAREALRITKEECEGYGKGAIIGMNGELEHGHAILHPKLGAPFREALGGGKAIIPSAAKMGGPGAELDVPTHYKDAAFVRTHFDAMPISVQDAPREDEILIVLVVTNSGRPLPRIGGLKKEEAKKEDGLR
ncbi:MAG: amino acid synthesis family protein [Deltaproteobacteria bacterium]|nr:MAG: peptide synthetase [Desulfobacteraceae bacterium 4484_190.3]RLB39577.1 MAG: amino acid synthesis family protein [Deltaproteobacteria bacterium]